MNHSMVPQGNMHITIVDASSPYRGRILEKILRGQFCTVVKEEAVYLAELNGNLLSLEFPSQDIGTLNWDCWSSLTPDSENQQER